KNGLPVDFRKQQGIYCLYDDDFRLVYVGKTESDRLLSRLISHTRHSLADRWTKFSWFGLNPVTPSGEKIRASRTKVHPRISAVLDQIEAILIAAAEPLHNSQSGRFGQNVIQYYQYEEASNVEISDKLDETLDKIVKIEKQLKKIASRQNKK